MRALVGLGLIGLLVAGGIWGKNEIFGSDKTVCNELRAFQTAALTGGQYHQNAMDFEFKQVRDPQLRLYANDLYTKAEQYKDSPAALIPSYVVLAVATDVGAGVNRCNVIGK